MYDEYDYTIQPYNPGYGDQPGDYDMPTTPQTPNWWDLLPVDDFGPPIYTPPLADNDYGPPIYSPSPANPQAPEAGSNNFTNFLRSTLQKFMSARGGQGDVGSQGRGGVGLGGGVVALLSALAARNDRPQSSGGGVGAAYAGPRQMTRTMEQGKYGPIARYAAQGGVMQAYAQGGSVRPFPMQDGGFVMTKRAVDGAGGMENMKRILPETVPIRGPGHGTSDSIPAYIQGKNSRSPAAVSNGEAYVPPGRNAKGLYSLMKTLERKA